MTRALKLAGLVALVLTVCGAAYAQTSPEVSSRPCSHDTVDSSGTVN